MNVNFAERAHNHNWKLDPIVRSLLDTDFYKFLMLQFIWKNFPTVTATSEVHNRTITRPIGRANLRRHAARADGARSRPAPAPFRDRMARR